jgi:hypothetical protein
MVVILATIINTILNHPPLPPLRVEGLVETVTAAVAVDADAVAEGAVDVAFASRALLANRFKVKVSGNHWDEISDTYCLLRSPLQ